MTDVGVLEVVEVDEALDFEPTCEWSSCEATARWVARPACCRKTQVLLCDEHLAVARDAFTRMGMMQRHVPCGGITESIEWEPLGGRRG